jgi:hypothetical protein
MTTAHLFYIPVILMVGFLAGYFAGRSAEAEALKKKRKQRARRQAAKKKRAEQAESNAKGKAGDVSL